jgi:hypothetical protein
MTRLAMPHRYSIGVLAIFVLAGCDQSTAPADIIDEAAVAQFAEAVSESSDVHLPSLGSLLRATREAIQATDGGHEEAIRHFRAARRLAAASEDSIEAGNDEAGRTLANRSRHRTLSGIVATLGSEAVEQAVAGSAAGLDRLQGHLAGRDVAERVATRLARIGEIVAAADTKLAAGELVAALHRALTAAKGIRQLSPRYRARRLIARATDLLDRATAAVGDAPTEEEATAIGRAGRLLGVARDEFEARHNQRALAAAQRSRRLSWGVVQGRATDAG